QQPVALVVLGQGGELVVEAPVGRDQGAVVARKGGTGEGHGLEQGNRAARDARGGGLRARPLAGAAGPAGRLGAGRAHAARCRWLSPGPARLLRYTPTRRCPPPSFR